MKPTYILYSLLLLIGSCVKPYNPDTLQTTPMMVVDGIVTDQADQTNVSLSQTADYKYNSLNLTIQKATVTLTDNTGQTIPFREIRAGYYKPQQSGWKGIPGRTYTLTITTTDGKRYQSQPDLLKSVPPIDTIYYEYSRSLVPGTERYDKGFDVYVDTKDAETTGDYFRWDWQAFEPLIYCEIQINRNSRTGVETQIPINCCTDCWDIKRCYACVTTMSDKLVNGKKISRQPVLRAPFESTSKYYVEVTQYSMSEAAFLYWKTVRDVAGNTGGIFDAAPVTVGGNVKNVNDPNERIFGFFGASGTSTKPILIDRSKTGDTPNLLPPLPLPPSMPPPCKVCEESIYRTAVKPRWWAY